MSETTNRTDCGWCGWPIERIGHQWQHTGKNLPTTHVAAPRDGWTPEQVVAPASSGPAALVERLPEMSMRELRQIVEAHGVDRVLAAIDALASASPAPAPEQADEEPIDVEALRDALGDAVAWHEGKMADEGQCGALRMQRVEFWRRVYEGSTHLLKLDASPAPACAACAEKDAEIGKMARALLRLKRGECWCEMGVGNPNMTSHSSACKTVTAILHGQ